MCITKAFLHPQENKVGALICEGDEGLWSLLFFFFFQRYTVSKQIQI